MPAWAIIAVPVVGVLLVFVVTWDDGEGEGKGEKEGGGRGGCTENEVELYALPILLTCIPCSAEEGFVFFSAVGGGGVRVWDSCC